MSGRLDTLHVFLLHLANPRIGLPLLLLAVALLLWLLAAPRGRPRRKGFDPPVPVPDRDPVSRTVLALRTETYSAVLLEAFDRLDAALRRRRGLPIVELPRSTPAALAIPRAESKQLRKLAERLTRLHLYARELEAGSRLRWDFWRSLANSRRRFFVRLDLLLGEVDSTLKLLERTP
ncbi:MAG: hypothetical protein L3K13_02005 [Thermoplasmata archaeon]|nr:hypothetical protein [Thermoplasmata archaeon]